MSTHASPLGDARHGKLPEQILAFGRALRRAGVPLDSARIGLACDAARLVGIEAKPDLQAALQAVFVSREQDRAVFAELFDVDPRAGLVEAASTEELFDRFDGRVPAELRGELESLRERLVAELRGAVD